MATYQALNLPPEDSVVSNSELLLLMHLCRLMWIN